jgi:hypothetical protein
MTLHVDAPDNARLMVNPREPRILRVHSLFSTTAIAPSPSTAAVLEGAWHAYFSEITTA